MQRTYMARSQDVNRHWYVVDATEKALGRLAASVARVLMGKHKPTYTPHVDVGDYVIVLNAEKVALSGRKRKTKTYDHYTHHFGGRKVVPFETMIARHPDQVITLAVRRMLPKNRLARHMLSKLKVYRGGEHPHAAQQPEELSV